jgi:signal transduction histidine kinase
MGQQKEKNFLRSYDMALAGVTLGLIFWFLEASIHAYIFHRGSFLDETLPIEPHELWMRSLVVFLMILFGIFAQYMVNLHRRAEQALKSSEKELRILSRQLFTIQEDERARVSRDLHENISQYLCSIKFRMESDLNADKKDQDGSEDGASKKLIPMIQDVVEHLRRISMNLWPGTLDVLGIVAAIQSLLEEFRELNPGISVTEHFDVSEDEVLQSLKITVYRILQDALKNVALHSKADQVTVNLERTDHRLVLAVDDNGVGFNWAKALSARSSERGTGLASMKERTELSGGLFSIETAEGQGTSLRISWPMNPEKN